MINSYQNTNAKRMEIAENLILPYMMSGYTLCLKKVPTFKLSVTLSNLKRFS